MALEPDPDALPTVASLRDDTPPVDTPHGDAPAVDAASGEASRRRSWRDEPFRVHMPVDVRGLSLTIIAGRPRRLITASSSRPTREPDNDVSAINAMHSRVKSSTTARMRNLRLSVNVSLTKSRDQRWFGPCGNVSGALVPSALLRPPRRRTCSRSSAYNRLSFLWLMSTPSLRIMRRRRR